MFNTKYSKRNILLSPLLGGVEKVFGRVYLHAPQHFQEEEVVALTQILLLFLIGIWNSREGVLPRLRFLRLHLQIPRLHLQFPLQVVCSWLHHQEI